ENICEACDGAITNHGELVVVDSTLAGNGGEMGGALLNFGKARLLRVVLTDNVAESGAAGAGNDPDATLLLMESSVVGNPARSSGGGVGQYGAVLLVDTEITGNEAGFNGGGVMTPRLVLVRSAVTGNRAGSGGGGVTVTEATVVDSKIIDNAVDF